MTTHAYDVALGTFAGMGFSGRMSDMQIIPGTSAEPYWSYGITGAYRDTAGIVHKQAARVVVVLASTSGAWATGVTTFPTVTQWIVGDTLGAISVVSSLSAGQTVLAKVLPPTTAYLSITTTPPTAAHLAWLVLYPPVDDAACTARVAAYNGWGLPTQSNPPGPNSPAVSLRSATTLPVWNATQYSIRMGADDTLLTTFAIPNGGINLTATYRGVYRNFLVDCGAVGGLGSSLQCIGLSPSTDPTTGYPSMYYTGGVEIDDFRFQCSTAQSGTGGGAGAITAGDITARNGTITDSNYGIQYPYNSVFENILMYNIGRAPGCHANGMYLQGSYNVAVRLCNFDMSSAACPEWNASLYGAGAGSTSVLTHWDGGPVGYSGRTNITYERCRVHGASVAFRFYGPGTPNYISGANPINGVLVKNCAITRGADFWYGLNDPSNIIGNIMGIPMIISGNGMSNIVFESCFFPDSGELCPWNGTFSTNGSGVLAFTPQVY